MVKDIEVVMDEIAVIAIAKLPTELGAVNTDKGDSLLDTADIAARYFLWQMQNNYKPVSFTQFISDDPQIIANKFETAEVYPITISACINYNGVTNMPVLKQRYNRAIKQLIMNWIAPKYTDVLITKVKSLIGTDLAGNSYELAETTFSLSLAT